MGGGALNAHATAAAVLMQIVEAVRLLAFVCVILGVRFASNYKALGDKAKHLSHCN